MPTDRTLSDMLEKGEIDGLLGARAPSCFLRGAPNVGAAVSRLSGGRGGLLQEDQAVSDHARHRHPQSLVEKYPWLAVNVYKAFLKAKALCMHELGQIGHLHATLPWPVAPTTTRAR